MVWVLGRGRCKLASGSKLATCLLGFGAVRNIAVLMMCCFTLYYIALKMKSNSKRHVG